MIDLAQFDHDAPMRTRGPDRVFWAPRPFVQMLREAAGNPSLEVYWDPRRPLFSEHPDTPDLCRHPPCQMEEMGVVTGAWVIAEHLVEMRTMVWRGHSLTFPRRFLRDVFALDGLFAPNPKTGNQGLPMTLGYWIVRELRHSDNKLRGVEAVRRDKDAAHRKAYELQFASSRKMADDGGSDHPMLRIQNAAGQATRSREAQEKKIRDIHRRIERRQRENQAFLKEMGL